MTLMSELPAGDTHDVIRHSGQAVAVVVPIEEYLQLRKAMQEQHVNEEFDAARARYLARREAGAVRYVSQEEAGRRLGMPSRCIGELRMQLTNAAAGLPVLTGRRPFSNDACRGIGSRREPFRSAW